jgi:hypothetical protein
MDQSLSPAAAAQHPITPPPELALQWINEYLNEHPEGLNVEVLVVSAAQWGSDQELEACCEWLDYNCPSVGAHHLRADRRPKPPSLKERALQAWVAVEAGTDDQAAMAVIRRALEALDD